MSYSIKNLREIADSAAKTDFSHVQEAHFARKDLDAQATGLAYHVLHPNKRQAFAHRHQEAEEVYVVLDGSGRVKLDEEIVDVSRLDAIRVAPEVARAFEAGPDGLELVVFGPHYDGDGEMIQDFWRD
jgi:mannose-6-phosphate isomerase-like protein (cupin superfamily)